MSRKTSILRWLPLVLIGFALLAVWKTGIYSYLSLQTLTANYSVWRGFIDEYWVLSSLVFLGIYVLVVALSIPGGTALTVASGVLFGAVWGSGLTIVSATLGAAVIFTIARSTLGDFLRQKAGPWMARMQKGFAENEWSYMFALRFLPIVPFFVVNIVPAFLGVRLHVFVVATFFGIMPATIVYATLGAGLSDIVAVGTEISLAQLKSPKLLGSLVALGFIALIPAIYKKFRRAKS